MAIISQHEPFTDLPVDLLYAKPDRLLDRLDEEEAMIETLAHLIVGGLAWLVLWVWIG